MAGKNTVVLDIGAYSLKMGVDDNIRSIPNCIFKSKVERRKSAFISSQIENCKDHSGLFYMLPFQKGYLVNWDAQRQIWDHAFGKEELNFQEEFPLQTCCVIVDAGYSFTHVVPYDHGKKITKALIRIDAGGKLLTNHLKEIISYRQLQVMDETYVMNQVKEDVCYVSMDFVNDMDSARLKGEANPLLCEYVLPDYTTTHRGYIKPHTKTGKDGKKEEQIMRIAGERVSVPEILFHPSDIGIPQMGIPEAIVHSISKCPPDLQPHLYNNILLTGGSCLFRNFRDRVEKDVRSLAPSAYRVRVTMSQRPDEYACRGGLQWSKTDTIREHFLTLEEYQEAGQSACQRQFIGI